MMKYVEESSTGTHSVGYTYDNINNLTALVETINGVERKTSYTYDEDNRPTSISTNGTSRSYTYDQLGRVSADVTKQGDTELFDRTYVYKAPAVGGVSNVLSRISYSGTNWDRSFMVNRDANGNIHYALEGTYINTYEYDSANQLIREDHSITGTTTIWTYDNAGNILTREVYPRCSGTPDPATRISVVNYTYGDDKGWGDLLTAYNGVSITHDEIGNPLNDGTWTYTWQHGRQLASMARIDQSESWQSTYNADGMRTQRKKTVIDPETGETVNDRTYNYTYLGGQLTHMTVDGHTMYFAYDASGTPMAMTYDGVNYYYVTNIQGDVIFILDNTGTELVRYIYDAWGNLISTTGTLATTVGFYNPLRYRGYVYDAETGLYYLQSRYYNPEMGRFINIDVFISTGYGVLGNNMFAYCNNNPIVRIDPTGDRYTKYADTCVNHCPHEERKFFEDLLTHMARNRQDGNTCSVGIAGGVTFGDLTVGGSGVLSVDTSHNYALQHTTSTGVSPGFGASGGLSFTYTNATDVQDLAGVSKSYGFSVVAPYGISVDYITFTPASNPNITCWGVSIIISLGGDFEVHAAENYTNSKESWNLFIAIRDALYGG